MASTADKVRAGMDVLVWQSSREEWQVLLDRRSMYLDEKFSFTPIGANENAVRPARALVRRLRKMHPPVVHISATGIIFGDRARLWRTTWGRLARVELVRAGWEALAFVFVHTWLSNETIVVPLPLGLADSSEELLGFLESRALAPGERPPDRPEDLPRLTIRPQRSDGEG